MACLYIIALDAWEGRLFNHSIQRRYSLSLVAITGQGPWSMDFGLHLWV